jgi:hypothetical protein
MACHPRGAAGTKTSAVDRGSGPYRPQTAGPRSRRRRVRDQVDDRSPSTPQVARLIGSTPAPLRRWIDRGLISQYDGAWTSAAIAHAQPRARMRARGHLSRASRWPARCGARGRAAAARRLHAHDGGARRRVRRRHRRALHHGGRAHAPRRCADHQDDRRRGHRRQPDPAALVDWAVGFQALHATRPLARIGMHYGEVLYRDGDDYGREVTRPRASRPGPAAARSSSRARSSTPRARTSSSSSSARSA